jgi:hypothetical protein
MLYSYLHKPYVYIVELRANQYPIFVFAQQELKQIFGIFHTNIAVIMLLSFQHISLTPIHSDCGFVYGLRIFIVSSIYIMFRL